jgi:hypothetical protein
MNNIDNEYFSRPGSRGKITDHEDFMKLKFPSTIIGKIPNEYIPPGTVTKPPLENYIPPYVNLLPKPLIPGINLTDPIIKYLEDRNMQDFFTTPGNRNQFSGPSGIDWILDVSDRVAKQTGKNLKNIFGKDGAGGAVDDIIGDLFKSNPLLMPALIAGGCILLFALIKL